MESPIRIVNSNHEPEYREDVLWVHVRPYFGRKRRVAELWTTEGWRVVFATELNELLFDEVTCATRDYIEEIRLLERLKEYIDSQQGDSDEAFNELTNSLNQKLEDFDKKLTSSMQSVYKYKGSLEDFKDLPKDAEIGDTYNIVNSYDENPPGANYAWTGKEWDCIGGDLSEVINKNDMIITSEEEFLDILNIER